MNDENSDSIGPLASILDAARDAAAGTEVDLKTLVEAFGDRAFGPVMILCALFLMTPIGAIPRTARSLRLDYYRLCSAAFISPRDTLDAGDFAQD
jgi:hypothetical protein